MPLTDNQSEDSRGIDWLAIIRILLAQVLVLLALSGAAVGYLRWSSDVNWEEFANAGKSPAPVQAIKGHAFCDRRI